MRCRFCENPLNTGVNSVDEVIFQFQLMHYQYNPAVQRTLSLDSGVFCQATCLMKYLKENHVPMNVPNET